MKKAILENWIGALKSGKYAQTRKILHRDYVCDLIEGEEPLPAGYCCLGVLSEVICNLKEVKKTGYIWNGFSWVNKGITGTFTGSLPPPIQRAIKMPMALHEDMIQFNDNEKLTFKQIAKKLESKTYWKKYT